MHTHSAFSIKRRLRAQRQSSFLLRLRPRSLPCPPKNAKVSWPISVCTKRALTGCEIHTDFERGFIRAETIAYEDYVKFGGEAGARDAGKLRSEGKDYVVQDGDVMLFRFNV